ncbi:MAG: helix-hairpin-helix domain-containing protein [Coprobacillus sp.]
MNKKIQVIGFLLLVICSVIYDFQSPDVRKTETKRMSYVILEGEFLKQGKYEYEGDMELQDIVDKVGVSAKANLDALSLTTPLKDEARIYLPPKSTNTISLNKATKEEFMTIKGVGEKTAQKIIDYRNENGFSCIEDIMNVSGIGEKTYLRLREFLCL